ncbi:MAG TPA: DUF6152 family protein [Caulobacteraceae bacterium]|jgi:hypothetical protein|nr:DUF6152 family protein [Caulobacteraceae bacterium]
MERANIAGRWRLALASAGALGVAAAASGPALAHHSFAMFDQKKTVKLEGTVKELQLTNPHSWLMITAPGKAGKPVVWSIEMGGPHQVEEMGLTSDSTKPGHTMKAGDKVTVSMHPMRDNRPGGSFISAVLADGYLLAQGTRPNTISEALAAGKN